MKYFHKKIYQKISPSTVYDTSLTSTSLWLVLTSFTQTYFLPVIGLVDPKKLKPADLVVSEGVELECSCPHFFVLLTIVCYQWQGVNKDSYLILDTLPPE